jgi:hypothetical protein
MQAEVKTFDVISKRLTIALESKLMLDNLHNDLTAVLIS